jgi:hypothetical protein
MTLGELIDRLERILPDLAEDADIWFDFGYMVPTGGFCSYRGDYSQIAIEHGQIEARCSNCSVDSLTVADFLEKLKQCEGKTFQGWKGGDYKMGLYTPLWVANPGHWTRTQIVGVIDDGTRVYLETRISLG